MVQEALVEEKEPLSYSFVDPLEIPVHDDVDRAIKELKKRVNREGILKDLKLRRFYEKPSERKKRKLKEAEKRRRKLLRRKNRRQHLLERRLRSL
jgi:small subunit ribosomal protein S21